ncbi:hypothetical protein BN439_0916 [Erwinia amylovora Ea644]|nr:hypothetical protein BN439_0916 [Erwinia amylovora Ea644]CCP06024.1 hypothetical protein BN440_0974 [Erwinia amylovora MR1]
MSVTDALLAFTFAAALRPVIGQGEKTVVPPGWR